MYLSSHKLYFALLFFTSSVLPSPTTPAPETLPQIHAGQPSSPSPAYFATSLFPQLKRLRDAAFHLFGGYPDTKICNKKEQLDYLPATLRSKYGRDVVLRFNITSSKEERALSKAADTLFLDVWSFTSTWADIRLREDDVASLLNLLPISLSGAYTKLMPDLARAVYRSYPSTVKSESSDHKPVGVRSPFHHLHHVQDGVDNVFFRDYQPMSVIVPWMRLMSSMFSTHVKMIFIGLTHEGREIYALRIGVHPASDNLSRKRRQTVLVTGGSHAREWVSVSTVIYMAWSMITSYGKSPAITKLIQQFDWVFVPTTNVDGYVYTWETDRLWRKNRQNTSLPFCQGLDLDRSYGFEWDGTSSSENPCSESYPGDQPFQAVESRRLAEWARNETANDNVRFVGFLDMHSYAQQVLYPYSYTCEKAPPSQENLEELGLGLAKAIRLASGQYYEVHSACEGAFPYSSGSRGISQEARTHTETAGGSAIDWFYHEMDVKYSYQIKLRDTGSYGFLLPSENIVPTGEEAFNALKYLGDFLLSNKGRETLVDMAGLGAGSAVPAHARSSDIEDVYPELRRTKSR